MDHPCNLTRTTVKISFPELKGEVFVNLLGYKEPNLIPLWRCKGSFDSIGFSEKTILDTNEEIVFYFVEEQEGEKYLRLKFF